MPVVDVIIPAYNEQESITKVIGDLDKKLVREIVVVNNNSTDQTGVRAETAGARVLNEVKQGYGAACLCGIRYLQNKTQSPDIVVFLDADYSDHPEELVQLIQPIADRDYDLVIGSRATGKRERGSMSQQQVIGNWLATRMLKWFYGVNYTDLGPFRAIRFEKLLQLKMKDETYGWTVEMQVKAAKQKMKCAEVPVSYRRRIGESKISGTVKGTIMAGYKIITTLIKYA